MKLFPKKYVVGVFRSFSEGGLEFRADIALPYRSEFQRIPMYGRFVLVQLENPDEAILGRIASFSSEGRLSSGGGEEFAIRTTQDGKDIPEELRKQYLKYRINIRVLGVIRNDDSDSLIFVPSHRRLPHVGSLVAFPTAKVLKEICGHNIDGAKIGNFALGEYIYAGSGGGMTAQPWMRIVPPEVSVRFPVSSLVSRRSFVFARAGFGKSNLNKLLFSKLYEKTPTIEKRKGRKVEVGTIIVDPDGEYFWPDFKGRPGLCDVPHLRDKLVVFTGRRAPSDFYESFTVGGTKLDIRQLSPSDIVSIALSPERQEQQNVAKLRSLSPQNWSNLVDLIDRDRYGTDVREIGKLLNLSMPSQLFEANAARSNMTNIVGMLHDKSSRFMEFLLTSLKAGKICVVDASQMHGTQSLILVGIILRQIFDHNQKQFTEAEPETIPTIAVIEEAQSVLSNRATAAEPYVTWVKEGRKYDLGAFMITQQPGSIPNEILSQGDNWFIFHLLSAGDLTNLKRANSHFSDDLLSSLLNEPIPGQGVFWSSVSGKPYPVSLRALSFEDTYKALDPKYSGKAVQTYASKLRSEATSGDVSDMEVYYRQLALNAVKGNVDLIKKLETEGVAWYGVLRAIESALPKTLPDVNRKANDLVALTLDTLFSSRDNKKWSTFVRDSGSKKVRCIKVESTNSSEGTS